MSIEKLKPSFHFEAERIEQLKQIAPEAFADGKIIWENLKEALGDFIDEENVDSEHFGLFWPGKREARKIVSTPSLGTLVPCPNQGVDENTTNNIFIEGDNLEVLKLLQKSYANRIKMIYIDPPYNTGNDFIYDDNFSESIDEYLKRTGQLDEEAKPISANTKADGRFHSKWLSMMYPRLKLARNLLKDDGIIFISIDDNEIHNLRQLMNEIFGEENFIANIAWRRSDNQSNIGAFARVKEYILIFSKSKFDMSFNKLGLTEKAKKEYRYEDSKGKFRRDILLHKTRGRHFYEVKTKNGNTLKGPWMIKQDDFLKLDKDDGIYWTSGGEEQPYGKIYLHKSNGQIPNDFWGIEYGTNQRASAEIEAVFGKRYFDFPKPTSLIKNLIKLGSDDEDIILDFFSGSGTTAHSVIDINIEEKTNRKFICVQLPELVDEKHIAFIDGYKKISQIAIERIKRVIKSIKKKSDIGFKLYTLQHSSYKPWKNYTGTDIKELENLFESNSSPLVEDWKPENLLSEIILIEGFPLDSIIEVIDTYKKNKITQVSSDFCEHKLLVCLDFNIDDNTIKSLELSDNDIFICLDTAVSDKDKVALQDKGLIKTI
jgi:adenine-specific DNA-methyltransferase